MITAQGYTFDLAEELVQQLEREFGPDALRGELQKAFGGGAPGDEEAGSFFAGFGRRWMGRVLELGEQHKDRTYEVLQDVATEIEDLKFPFFSQRFIEIAYLGTQPIYTLPITMNGAKGLGFKMPFCGYFTAIKESMGGEFANKLHCRSACETACRRAFEQFGFDVAVTMDATMPVDEFCQFSIVRA